jgi:mannose/fructose/N-acetylgalactosamine-specific phosphotransferase system component IIC
MNAAWLDGVLALGGFALAGGLLGLDRRAAFQAMLSQPIISVTLLGYLCEQPGLGVALAVRLQLLWMASMLFGASTPPNENVASVVSAGAAFLGTAWLQYDGAAAQPALVVALAILLGAPFAELGRQLDMRLDRSHLQLARRADLAAAQGDLHALSMVPLRGMVRVFAANAVLVALGVVICAPLVRLLSTGITGAPAVALSAFSIYAVPALGVAVSFALVKRRRALLLGTCAFALCVLVLPADVFYP